MGMGGWFPVSDDECPVVKVDEFPCVFGVVVFLHLLFSGLHCPLAKIVIQVYVGTLQLPAFLKYSIAIGLLGEFGDDVTGLGVGSLLSYAVGTVQCGRQVQFVLQ